MQRLRFILILLLTVVSSLLYADVTVHGTVLNASDGEPVIGASVLVKGSNTGTISDFNGQFTLEVPDGATLVVSYIGMKSREVAASANLTIRLEEDTEVLEEVVVTAFGEQKKSAFTGSAAVVDASTIEQKQVTNVISALQGEAAGVQMVNNSGDPTAEPSLRIRGFSSISAGKDPLIIVDGAPYDGGWNNLNPADVASITVLKDAASAALYGARGANGIVMITTKRATAGDATITVDAKWGGTMRIRRDYETINDIGQYYETYYKALYNYAVRTQNMTDYAAHTYANNTLGQSSGLGGLGYMAMSVPDGEYLIGDNGRLNPHATLGGYTTYRGQTYQIMPDNWMDEIARTGFRHEYNISANGGNDKMQFFGSLGYLKTEGICRASDFERYSARLKANYQAKRWLRLGGNVSYARSARNYTSSSENNVFYFAQQIAPVYPVYLRDASGQFLTDANGKMYDYGDGAVIGLDRAYQPKYNPIQDAELNTSDNREHQFSISGFTDITPIDGLKITLNATATGQMRKFSSTSNPFYGYSKDLYPTGYVYEGSDETFSFNAQQLISYARSFGAHNMDVLLGHESYFMHYSYLWGSRIGMASYFDNQTLAGAITVNGASSSRQSYNSEGVFLRAQYNYKERYFASASVRADASSRFHPKHRWGAFFSLGGAWMISKEDWFPTTDWANMLKLKASFGQVGNDNISDFLYMNTYSIVNSDGHVALVANTIGNENITWETLNNFNVGAEFELLKGRLRGNLEYFYKLTTDMLCFVGAPKSAGYGGSYDNIGDMENQGAEIELSGDLVRTNRVTWTIGANATFYRNRITKIAPQLRTTKIDPEHPGYSSGIYYYGEGLPLYTWYMPRYAGVDDEGRSQWYRTAADGSLTTTTQYADATSFATGNPNPIMYGGFNTSLRFYGVDMSVSFAYSLGGKAYDYGYSYLMGNPVQSNTGYGIHVDMLHAWSEDNTASDIPRWQYGDQNASAFSDRFLTDASSLTLQNVNIGYSLPQKLIGRLRLTKLRFYLAAENLYYWTCRKGFDPRGSFNGEATTATYAPSRTISGGLSLAF